MSDTIKRADAIEAVHKYFVKEIDKTPHEIDEDGYDVYTDMPTVNSLLSCNKELSKAIKALPSAEAVSMEEHVKELNDLASAWKNKFINAEKRTEEIYDETMAKVANECKECKERLRNLRPSAEAVNGEWIKTVDGNGWHEWWVFKCPFCGATIEDKQRRSWEYNFCPNCGARMKGGGSE